MPTILKDADGNDIEVETPDEVAARIESEREAAAEEARTAALAEANEAIAAKEKDLQDAQEKLKKFEDKDYNFSKLRNKNEKEESDLKDSVKKLSDEIAELKGQPAQQQRDEFVSANIGADQELRDKFDHYYGRLGKDAKTPAERASALKEALILATGVQQGGTFISKVLPTGGNPQVATGNEVSEESREFGAALGVTEEDRKKYSKPVNLF